VYSKLWQFQKARFRLLAPDASPFKLGVLRTSPYSSKVQPVAGPHLSHMLKKSPALKDRTVGDLWARCAPLLAASIASSEPSVATVRTPHHAHLYLPDTGTSEPCGMFP
jgi:hypothetical protein